MWAVYCSIAVHKIEIPLQKGTFYIEKAEQC